MAGKLLLRTIPMFRACAVFPGNSLDLQNPPLEQEKRLENPPLLHHRRLAIPYMSPMLIDIMAGNLLSRTIPMFRACAVFPGSSLDLQNPPLEQEKRLENPPLLHHRRLAIPYMSPMLIDIMAGNLLSRTIPMFRACAVFPGSSLDLQNPPLEQEKRLENPPLLHHRRLAIPYMSPMLIDVLYSPRGRVPDVFIEREGHIIFDAYTATTEKSDSVVDLIKLACLAVLLGLAFKSMTRGRGVFARLRSEVKRLETRDCITFSLGIVTLAHQILTGKDDEERAWRAEVMQIVSINDRKTLVEQLKKSVSNEQIIIALLRQIVERVEVTEGEAPGGD